MENVCLQDWEWWLSGTLVVRTGDGWKWFRIISSDRFWHGNIESVVPLLHISVKYFYYDMLFMTIIWYVFSKYFMMEIYGYGSMLVGLWGGKITHINFLLVSLIAIVFSSGDSAHSYFLVLFKRQKCWFLTNSILMRVTMAPSWLVWLSVATRLLLSFPSVPKVVVLRSDSRMIVCWRIWSGSGNLWFLRASSAFWSFVRLFCNCW